MKLVLLYYGSIAFILFSIVAVNSYAKVEICKTYYKEISMLSCFISNYGMPPKGK